MMHRMLIALVLGMLAAGPAVASEKTDVLAVLHQFADAFNKGDMKSWAWSDGVETEVKPGA
jgi:hypothetical protein